MQNNPFKIVIELKRRKTLEHKTKRFNKMTKKYDATHVI